MPIQAKTAVGTAFLLAVGLIAHLQGQQIQVQKSLDSSVPKSEISFTDIDNGEHTLPCKPEFRGLVLIFINTDCPIANSYHPTLRRLREEFSDARFDFALVHADSELNLEEARKHKIAYEITWPVVLDPGNKLARRVSAKVTPEAIVINATGQVVYRGRIDDRHQSYGRMRPEASTHDLQVALKAISQDQSVPTRETKPVGCVIRYAD